MGWPFDEASWNSVEGAYYSAMGAEGFWVALSAILCIAALVVGASYVAVRVTGAGFDRLLQDFFYFMTPD
mgnify:CR=1 FL=1